MTSSPSLPNPQYIDLHVNGLKRDGVDCNFWKLRELSQRKANEAILGFRRYLFKEGVRAFVPTLITDSVENTINNLHKIKEYLKQYGKDEASSLKEGLAYIPGVHIEGGYISRTGSHPEEHKTALGPKIVDHLAKLFPGLIKLWTICPQVDKDGKHVEALRRHGITPSYGHSHASYEEAKEAFRKFGVRLVTHWGNGMKIFDKYNREEPSDEELAMLDTKDPELLKDAGLAVTAYQDPEVMMMAICGSDRDKDYHISPKLIKKLAETKRLILTTDAAACHAGTISDSGQQKRKYDLSGGQASLGVHVQNARDCAGLTEEQIQQAAVINPGEILNEMPAKPPRRRTPLHHLHLFF